MKSFNIGTILCAVIISLASANGVAEEQNKDRTGTPDGSSTCTQCHTGGGFNPQMEIIIEDETGTEVDAFIPGADYTLTVTLSSIPFPTVFGFQATALFDDLSNAGSFSDPGTGVQIEIVNNASIMNRHVVEHSNPGFVGNFEVQWTAPMDESDVTFYASGVTANGNNESSGDKATNIQRTLSPQMPDHVWENALENVRLGTYPDQWQLYGSSPTTIDRVRLIDLQGQIILDQRASAIPRQGLLPGMYIIHVQAGNTSKTFKVMHI
ncbi:MAG: T9SS type A sorting domain-containing protein [Flavobacteriales bacterium]|nr:T9SS type A sorting domain-containing protein [Flavobacteriales bacterium]